jgi:hypothetical protein
MKLFLMILIFSFGKVFARELEAVVTVLETPLFDSKNYEAQVVQYLRKGDVIKIHPSIGNDKEMDKFSPKPEKLSELKERYKKNLEYEQDPLFKGEEESTFNISDEFIPTLDRRGHRAYVLSSHIYVFFDDSRELNQKISQKDPTDYRLKEPLPTNYPFKKTTGLRNQFIMGITQPYNHSYDYPDKFKAKGFNSPLDLNYTYLKLAPGDYNNRLFIGGTFNFRHHKNTYLFYDDRTSEETAFRFGIGPTISYDAFKGEKNRVNLSHTILINFFEQFEIKQDEYDKRRYTGNSVAGLISTQYHRKNILTSDIDFVAGTSIELNSGTKYEAKNAGSNSSWWQNTGNDQFKTGLSYHFSAFVGLQSEY